MEPGKSDNSREGLVVVRVNGPALHPTGLREREKQNKLHRIRTAAEELFSEFGFEDVTTRQIAQRAQIGEATLFRYMSSKKELLLLVYGDKMERLLDRIEHDDASSSTRSDPTDGHSYCHRLYAIYEGRSAFYRDDPGNAAIYLREAYEAGSAIGNRSIEQGDRCIRLATKILREGQRVGALNTSVDPRLVAQNCHGIFLHEVDRTPVRGFPPGTIWERVRERLVVQLEPLVTQRR